MRHNRKIKESNDGQIPRPGISEIAVAARDHYFDRITQKVFDSINGCKVPAVSLRFSQAMSIGINGDDLLGENSLSADALYALMLFAMNGKIADPKSCERIKKYQDDLMLAAIKSASASSMIVFEKAARKHDLFD